MPPIRLKRTEGPETQRIIRAGQQEALPTVLRGATAKSRVSVLAFETMKQLPAFHMLDVAKRSGLLRPGQPVVETSSGTFALGLARVAPAIGHRCLIAADRAISPDLQAAIEARGAEVRFVDAALDATNVQVLRKELLAELAREYDGFIPNQYGNPANPESYRAAAEIACAAVGWVDVLVTTVGSGGHSRGLASLRAVNPRLRIVAVDTFGSVLFGLPAGPRALRGLGNGLMPSNVDHDIFNAVHWVTEDVALEGVLQVEEAGLGDRGLTAGAAWMVASWIADKYPTASVLTVFPDLGWRYREQVGAFRLRREAIEPPVPLRIERLSQAVEPWSWMRWGPNMLQRAAALEAQEA
jgi:S-sulfo-L-cysteine synthase (3-phospho-L-serine-dependent)